MADREGQKRAAARAAAALVRDGDRVGLGTGSTVAYLLPALAERRLSIRCVPTSPATARRALELGLVLDELDVLAPLDIAIDGTDQFDPAGWHVKGGGGAHTREKLVAYAARRFVVIASAEKEVDALRPPVPVEIIAFACRFTLAEIAPARLRPGAPPSPDGNLIADHLGAIDDPAALAGWLSATPGVVEHGLFGPERVSEVLVGEPDGSVRRVPGARDGG